MPLNAPSPDFLNGLKDLLGPQGWRAPEDTPEKFEEPRGKWRGVGALVLRPETVEEVAEIITRAAAALGPDASPTERLMALCKEMRGLIDHVEPHEAAETAHGRLDEMERGLFGAVMR